MEQTQRSLSNRNACSRRACSLQNLDELLLVAAALFCQDGHYAPSVLLGHAPRPHWRRGASELSRRRQGRQRGAARDPPLRMPSGDAGSSEACTVGEVFTSSQ